MPYLVNPSNRCQVRRGVSIVEAALVLALALLFVFGIIEYSRFFFVRNVLIEAAREGARFAVVHTYDKTTADVQNYTYQFVAPIVANFPGFSPNRDIQVFKADDSGMPIYDASGNPVSWTDAAYGEIIAVVIIANYKPITPLLLYMPPSIPVRVRCTMSSEAN